MNCTYGDLFQVLLDPDNSNRSVNVIHGKKNFKCKGSTITGYVCEDVQESILVENPDNFVACWKNSSETFQCDTQLRKLLSLEKNGSASEETTSGDNNTLLSARQRKNIITIRGDGNCMFRSILYAITDIDNVKIDMTLSHGQKSQLSAKLLKKLRNDAVEYMEKNKGDFRLIDQEALQDMETKNKNNSLGERARQKLDKNDMTLDGEFQNDYFKYMKEDGIFGTNLELVALAFRYNLKFVIYDPDNPPDLPPTIVKNVRHAQLVKTVYLSKKEGHYNVFNDNVYDDKKSKPLTCEFCRAQNPD